MFITPAVVGDTVYIGSCSGIFQALDRKTGNVLWELDALEGGAGRNFHGNPLVTDSSIFVGTDGTDGGYLYHLDRETGEVRWKLEDPSGVAADILGDGTRVFALSLGGTLRCVDIATGAVRWSFEGADSGPGLRDGVALAADRLVLGLSSGKVHAVDADTGKPIWSRDLGLRINTPVAILDGSAYVGTIEGVVVRLDLDTGTVIATHEREGPVYGTLVPVEKCLLALWNEDTLACLDPSLKTVRWSRRTDAMWSSFRPHLWKGVILAGTGDGELIALDPEDGKTLWERRVEGEIRGVGSGGKVLYVGTIQGSVFAVKGKR